MPNNTAPRKLYAIMRYAKIKSFTALSRDRNLNTRATSGENIIEGAPPPKELLANGSDDFVSSAQALFKKLGIEPSTLKGKVIAVETVTTASRSWFDMASEIEKAEWVRLNVQWAQKKFGRGLLSAKLHFDEEVWHIHFVAVPIVQKLDLPRGAKPKDLRSAPNTNGEGQRRNCDGRSVTTTS